MRALDDEQSHSVDEEPASARNMKSSTHDSSPYVFLRMPMAEFLRRDTMEK